MENNTSRKIVRVSKRKVLIIIIVLAAISIALYAYDKMERAQYGTTDVGSPASIPAFNHGNESTSMPRDYYGGNQPDITDTREFLKTSYSGNIRTREVSTAVKMVKGAVREVEGRVDSESSSEKYGYVSFVVPKAKFDAFREEIESITHKKLYTENITSQNLLSQKQSIEQQTEAATNYLSSLQTKKKQQTDAHNARAAEISQNLSSVRSQLVTVRQNKQATSDQAQYSALVNQEATLAQQEAALIQQRTNENQTYATQNQNITNSIGQAQKSVDGINKQDEQFTNNIETVNGTVSVNWISYWDMAALISPIHPTIIVIVLVLLLLFLLARKGYIPKIEFV